MTKKVLLVDDSSMMRSVIRNYLKDRDLIFIEAADGAEAFEKFKAEKPDLVFMDLMMPNVDGKTAIKNIKEFDSKANIIVCSSLSEPQMTSELVDFGISDMVVKPFKKDEVIPIVEKYLN